MFKVYDTILAEDIATAKFACNIARCKGACCVIGEAGAPVSADEIPVLRKAYKEVKNELRPRAREVVEEEGLIQGNSREGYELTCTDERECVFVSYENDIAHCAIQKAYFEGRLNWEKPLSCHLFPIRLKRVADFDYASFEYVPELCSPACEQGEEEKTYLSDFLEKPLVRRYGRKWYREFSETCKQIRNKKERTTN